MFADPSLGITKLIGVDDRFGVLLERLVIIPFDVMQRHHEITKFHAMSPLFRLRLND